MYCAAIRILASIVSSRRKDLLWSATFDGPLEPSRLGESDIPVKSTRKIRTAARHMAITPTTSASHHAQDPRLGPQEKKTTRQAFLEQLAKWPRRRVITGILNRISHARPDGTHQRLVFEAGGRSLGVTARRHMLDQSPARFQTGSRSCRVHSNVRCAHRGQSVVSVGGGSGCLAWRQRRWGPGVMARAWYVAAGLE